MTRKLYDYDSHVVEFDSMVVGCYAVLQDGGLKPLEQPMISEDGPSKKYPRHTGRFALVLEETAFFAEGGGQAADRGIMTEVETFPVLDVQEEGEYVYHFVDRPVSVGMTVHGKIDWDFRFMNMQQHSGEHVLSGLCYAWKGYHNVGFHMGENLTTIDFDGPLTEEELVELERRANEVVYENQPVTIVYPSPEELTAMDYRSKKALTGRVRIVRLGDADLCACCAPHVMKTGEIGIIKIVHAENYKGGIRITIVCGMRAVRDYEAKHKVLENVANLLTTKIENVEKQIHKTLRESEAMHERITNLTRSLITYRAKEILEQFDISSKIDGVDCAGEDLCADHAMGDLYAHRGGDGHVHIALVETELDNVGARHLINQLLSSTSGTAAVLLPKEGEDWMFIMGSNEQDLRETAKRLRLETGAKGGGSKEMIQGTVTGSKETLLAVFGR